MPPMLNANALITCPHGGTFKIIPSVAATITTGGMPTVTDMDMSVPMVPCTATPATVGMPPCIQVKAVPGTTTIKVSIKGAARGLTQSTQFLSIPNGLPCMVTFPGQVSVQGM